MWEGSKCSSGAGGEGVLTATGVHEPPEEWWRLRPVGPIKNLWHSLHFVRSSGGGIVGAGQHRGGGLMTVAIVEVSHQVG